MKRLALLLCVLAATLSTMAATAAAREIAPGVANCNGHTLVSANHVPEIGEPWGAVQLCRNGNKYFAIYINYATMPGAFWGTAWLYRYTDGVPDGGKWSCDSPLPHANGRVLPGQTWCIGPEIDGSNGRLTFMAEGRYYLDPDILLAIGQTARTR